MKPSIVFCLLVVQIAAAGPRSDSLDPDLRWQVFDIERRRVETIRRIVPACVCILGEDHSPGGSGVLIDPSGLGLTNFHVVAGMMKTRSGFGGLSDGKLYPLEVLGIDVSYEIAFATRGNKKGRILPRVANVYFVFNFFFISKNIIIIHVTYGPPYLWASCPNDPPIQR